MTKNVPAAETGLSRELAVTAHDIWAYGWETPENPSSAEPWYLMSVEEKQNWERIAVGVVYEFLKKNQLELPYLATVALMESFGSLPWPGWGPHKFVNVVRSESSPEDGQSQKAKA